MDDRQLALMDSGSRQLALFDYGTLDLDTRSFVQTKTAEIRILVKQTAQGIIEIGQRLIEVKEKLSHGEFLPWLNTEFGWHRDTANKFMNVAKNLSHMSNNSTFQMRALYLLASPSTPEPAREEALELAESGERITHQKAQELVAKYKAEAEAAKKEATTRQQVITTLEDRLASLEAKKDELAKERDFMLETKNTDAERLMSRNREIEQLTKQIEELKAQKVIEKEVKVEVEKLIEKVPEDYEQLKGEVTKLKERLRTSKQKTGEELSQYQRRVDDLIKRLAQKEEALASFDLEQKQSKALRKLSEGENCILEARRLLVGSHFSQEELKITIIRYAESIKKILNEFTDQIDTIDLEVVYDSTCTNKGA